MAHRIVRVISSVLRWACWIADGLVPVRVRVTVRVKVGLVIMIHNKNFPFSLRLSRCFFDFISSFPNAFLFLVACASLFIPSSYVSSTPYQLLSFSFFNLSSPVLFFVLIGISVCPSAVPDVISNAPLWCRFNMGEFPPMPLRGAAPHTRSPGRARTRC